jgi:hypothetical protein
MHEGIEEELLARKKSANATSSPAKVEAQLGYIPGREIVRFVVLDMCDPFRNFATRAGATRAKVCC